MAPGASDAADKTLAVPSVADRNLAALVPATGDGSRRKRGVTRKPPNVRTGRICVSG